MLFHLIKLKSETIDFHLIQYIYLLFQLGPIFQLSSSLLPVHFFYSSLSYFSLFFLVFLSRSLIFSCFPCFFLLSLVSYFSSIFSVPFSRFSLLSLLSLHSLFLLDLLSFFLISYSSNFFQDLFLFFTSLS